MIQAHLPQSIVRKMLGDHCSSYCFRVAHCLLKRTSSRYDSPLAVRQSMLVILHAACLIENMGNHNSVAAQVQV